MKGHSLHGEGVTRFKGLKIKRRGKKKKSKKKDRFIPQFRGIMHSLFINRVCISAGMPPKLPKTGPQRPPPNVPMHLMGRMFS
jgi:hypothetical protein